MQTLLDLAVVNGDLVLQANGSPLFLRAEDVILQDLRHAITQHGAAHTLIADDLNQTGVRTLLGVVEADPRVRPGTAQAHWQGSILQISATLLQGSPIALEVLA